ncbi:MAG: hypothetical protein H0T18_04800 [Chloroflexia bacterium]|nr:hypothetical protein [Chloroflexia bacterium]
MSRATRILDQHTQEALPPLRWLLQPNDTRFAHPAEIELARLLTFYGQRWAYEPTTFAVRWGSDGRPEEFVTPDFYLPDRDLYLELTTMRQRLVTRKNRKFRLLRKHYPNVRVRLLYLRDFERLQHVYGTRYDEQSARLGAVLYDQEDVERRIFELAAQFVAESPLCDAGERRYRPVLLGVGPGSDRFLTSLGEKIHALGVAVDLDRVDLTSMSVSDAAAHVRLTRTPSVPLAGRLVVIVQEVISSGLSAAFLENWLRRRGAEEVTVCALLDRQTARVVDVPLICRGFTAPDVALAGYGLTRRREFQNLPFIAEIETD